MSQLMLASFLLRAARLLQRPTQAPPAGAQAIWSHLLRNFDMEMVDKFPEADYQSMVVGPKACRIRYRRRKL